jgi:hypothetical protein
MTAIETSAPYSLSVPTPNGTITASFNVPTDPNWCGYINDVTGLDFAGVRENAEVFASADGGYHGPFWMDRRPITLGGWVMPTTPVSTRNVAQNKMMAVLAWARRQDGTLLFTPSGDSIQRGCLFRVQQPLRITTGQSNVQKNFTIAIVCADWRVITWAGSTAGPTNWVSGFVNQSVTSAGNVEAAPLFTVTGSVVNPVITNVLTGKKFTVNTTVAGGSTLQIQLNTTYPLILLNGVDVSNTVDPLNSDYTISVVPGAQTFQLSGTGFTTAASLKVQWNDSWA